MARSVLVWNLGATRNGNDRTLSEYDRQIVWEAFIAAYGGSSDTLVVDILCAYTPHPKICLILAWSCMIQGS